MWSDLYVEFKKKKKTPLDRYREWIGWCLPEVGGRRMSKMAEGDQRIQTSRYKRNCGDAMYGMMTKINHNVTDI